MNNGTYLLVDGNQKEGGAILTGTQDIVIINQLRRGVLDAALSWTATPYEEKKEKYLGLFNNVLCELPQERITESFLEKRSLIWNRKRGFLIWKMYLMARLARDKSYPEDVDWYFERELERSTPDKPSEKLLDYAQMSGREVQDVYEYFKLQIEENSGRKLMLHARAEKFSIELNHCTTVDDVDTVCKQMELEFWR